MFERAKPIVFFVLVGLVAGYILYNGVGSSGIVKVGQLAPDFSIKSRDGREIKLSDYRGKVVFLNFWATWCPPCIKEMPDMETLNNKFKDRKFQMVTISVDNDWEDVDNFYKELGLTLPTYLDPGHQVAYNIYRITKFPETFLIDANGFVVRHKVGEESWADPRVMAGIETLIRQNEAKQQVSTN